MQLAGWAAQAVVAKDQEQRRQKQQQTPRTPRASGAAAAVAAAPQIAPDSVRWRAPQVRRKRELPLYTDVNWEEDITVWLGQRQTEEAQWQETQTAGSEKCREIRWVLSFSANDAEGSAASMAHMQEVWSLCLQLWESGLHLEHKVSSDRETIFIMVGAKPRMLRDQAVRSQMPMRMRQTMGMTKYRPDLAYMYPDTATSASSMTPEFNSAQEQQLVRSLMDAAMLLPLEHQATIRRSKVIKELKRRLSKHLAISAKLLKKLVISFGAQWNDHAVSIGPVIQKVAHLLTIDGAFSVYPLPQSKAASFDIVEVGGEVIDFAADAVETVVTRSMELVEDLLRFSNKKQKQQFVGAEDMLRRQRDLYQYYRSPDGGPVVPLEWKDLELLLVELENWMKHEGRNERFTGLLNSFFPTHDYTELLFLRKCWTRRSFICTWMLEAKNNEGLYTDSSHYSWTNEPEEQLAIFYQPITEIRDYFGDEIALYVQYSRWQIRLSVSVVYNRSFREFD